MASFAEALAILSIVPIVFGLVCLQLGIVVMVLMNYTAFLDTYFDPALNAEQRVLKLRAAVSAQAQVVIASMWGKLMIAVGGLGVISLLLSIILFLFA